VRAGPSRNREGAVFQAAAREVWVRAATEEFAAMSDTGVVSAGELWYTF